MNPLVSGNRANPARKEQKKGLPVVGRIAILLQEIIFDQLGYFEGDLVCFSKRSLDRKGKK